MHQYFLYAHIDGVVLFEIINKEDFNTNNSSNSKSYLEYDILTNALKVVSSIKIESEIYLEYINNMSDMNDNGTELFKYEEIIYELINLNSNDSSTMIYSDKFMNKILKRILLVKNMGNIELKTNNMNIYRGIKKNLVKMLKNNTETNINAKNNIKAAALKFSRSKVGESNDYTYVVHVNYELDQIEREIENLSKMLMMKVKDNGELNNRQYLVNSLTSNALFSEDKQILFKILEEKLHLFNKLNQHLSDKMMQIAPNTRELLGDRLLCRMLHRTGGMLNYAMYPASTIQLIGAEKSLFNCLKRKTNTPKHGMIYGIVQHYCNSVEGVSNSEGMSNVLTEKQIGMICRDIANKSCITAKIDISQNNSNDGANNSYGKALHRSIVEKTEKFLKNKDATNEREKTTEEIIGEIVV